MDTDILQKLLQGCSIPQNTAEVGDSEAEEDEGEEVRESPPLPVIAAEINMSDRELHLATVPGEDVFNPRARRFEHEELRPLPVMRKAKKVRGSNAVFGWRGYITKLYDNPTTFAPLDLPL